VDGGDRGAGQARQILVHALAILDRGQHRPGLLVLLEFADVGSGDEAGRLGRTDHYPAGRLDAEALDDFGQLVKDRPRQGVHRAAGTVQAQHDDAVLGALGAPMGESQAFEHGWHPVGECRAGGSAGVVSPAPPGGTRPGVLVHRLGGASDRDRTAHAGSPPGIRRSGQPGR